MPTQSNGNRFAVMPSKGDKALREERSTVIKCKCGALFKNWASWKDHEAMGKPYVPLRPLREEVERREEWEERHMVVKSEG